MTASNPRHMGVCIQCHRERLLWSDNVCSQKCRNEHKKTITYSICRNCGKHLPKPQRGPMRQYCDRTCKSEYQRKQRELARRRTTKARAEHDSTVTDLERRAGILRDKRRAADRERAGFDRLADLNEQAERLLG